MRYYSSVASSKVLDSPVSNVATSMTLNNVTGLPITHPYTLVIEPDTGNEEIVLVTGSSGSVLTVVRGENTDNGVKGGDGTSARAHDAGVVVKHMVTARDLQEPQNHMNAATLVHGLGAGEGAVVGVDKTQTLTNKTLTSPALTGTPTAPTADAGTNTTQVATTAFVQNAVLNNLTTAYAEASAPGGTLNGGTQISGVPFTSESLDNTGMHNLVTNTDRFQPTLAGIYLVNGYIGVTNANTSNATTTRILLYRLISGSGSSVFTQTITIPANSTMIIPFTALSSMNGTTQYFRLDIENTGSYSFSYTARIAIARVGV